MPQITINGKPCEFEGSPSILQVALNNGIEIPHYCYHDGLSVVASCRICLAEVWAPNPRNDGAIEPIPRLLPTCQTPAGDGHVVYTDSPRSIANQKAVMEYLLINHPLDCPICDQAGECHLQDYSYRYGRSESRFEEDKIKQPKKDLGPHVYLYSDRCIMCSRCVRFTREVTETSELCVVGRGSMEQIDLFPGVALDNELSGNVIDLCPVGALLDKDFLFTQRVWFLKQTPSIDGITASGDNISIEHNEGRIYRVKPRTNMAVNKWWISDEIRYGWKFVHDDERLDSCRRIQYGEQVSIPYATAIEEADEIMRENREAGGRVAALVSPMLSCEEAWLVGRYAQAWSDQPWDAILGVGPVPMDGEDKTFPPDTDPDAENAYTIRAEKAPNARGVRRVLKALAGGSDPAEFDAFLDAIKDASVVIVTGNYPSAWITKDAIKAFNKKRVILLDTLPNDLTPKAEIVIPGATWAEKAGTFENANHRLQAFEKAIPALEGSTPEGQVITDLMGRIDDPDLPQRGVFNPVDIRQRMASDTGLDEFVTEVNLPVAEFSMDPDMEFVDL